MRRIGPFKVIVVAAIAILVLMEFGGWTTARTILKAAGMGLWLLAELVLRYVIIKTILTCLYFLTRWFLRKTKEWCTYQVKMFHTKNKDA